MTQSKYRYLAPNSVTFLSLVCGVISILMSANGNLQIAGYLVLASYILDSLDGYLARRLKATSDYGLQLDSLVDLVSLGVAPAVVAYQHLQAGGMSMVLSVPFILMAVMAGAFRLARFNLLPPKKTGKESSLGLTISTGGATIALAVLAELSWPNGIMPDVLFLPLVGTMSLFMVSSIPFPAFSRFLGGRTRAVIMVALFVATIIVVGVFTAWFLWTLVFVCGSVVYWLYSLLRRDRRS